MDQAWNFLVERLQNRVEERISILSSHEATVLDVRKDVQWEEILKQFEVELLSNL